MKQLPLAIGAIGEGPEQSFERFVPGPNAAALAHLAQGAVAGAPVTYLWGASGTGKTHLLRALVRRAHAQGQRSGWFEPGSALPWLLDEAWSLIVIDDSDLLDEARQHAAFALFVDATTHGIPIAAAGRLPPVDLPLREDLRTRLGWGHVFALQPLAEPEMRAALRREADRRGVFLSDEVMDYLLTRFERNLKPLMAQLERLDRFSLAHKRAITVPMLKQMLAEEGAP
ncbi:DnaA regulatory inactivator Hda [uncultured Piscinibacter sp.]|uniref:DnaA regulatory inactivator Hda n=1 Tax=uncultured Piscinibacter sp. TaxID=1131835 RepID=UPI002637E252|nr:DnaA regulatory inactivator Hda [uncultured Piscinibacter sp.]